MIFATEFDFTALIPPAGEFLTDIPGWVWGVLTPIILFAGKFAYTRFRPTADSRTKLYQSIVAEMKHPETWTWESKPQSGYDVILRHSKYHIEFSTDKWNDQPAAVKSVTAPGNPTQLVNVLHDSHREKLHKHCLKLKRVISDRLARLHKDLSDKQAETQAASFLASSK